MPRSFKFGQVLPQGLFCDNQLFLLCQLSESKVAPTDSVQYRTLNQTIREVFPDALVAPGLMVAATDSRHFTHLSDHVYRFSPVRAKPEDLSRFHGTNERIATANLAEVVRFYHQLLQNTAAAPN